MPHQCELKVRLNCNKENELKWTGIYENIYKNKCMQCSIHTWSNLTMKFENVISSCLASMLWFFCICWEKRIEGDNSVSYTSAFIFRNSVKWWIWSLNNNETNAQSPASAITGLL